MVETARVTYLATAKKIERSYGLPVSLIKQSPTMPLPMATTGDGFTVFVVIPESSYPAALLKIREEFPHLHISRTPPVNEFVEMTRKNRQIIRNNIGANGLISPFFFHEEIYGNYAKGFRKAIRVEFSKELDEGIINWLKLKGINSEKEFRQSIQKLKRSREAERKLVGPKEQKYLQQELARIATQASAKDAQILIFFDRAARYLAKPLQKILQEAHHKAPLIFFVDPDLVRTAELFLANGAKPEKNYDELRKIFEKEFPSLVKSIRGKRVMLVDDQTHTTYSKKGMLKIIRYYKPKLLVATALSTTSEAPQPSWRSRGLYAIESRANSFRAKRKRVDPLVRRQISGLQSNLNRVADRVVANARKRC